ncbi:carboxyltransferase domain-containing protein, partial [Escherichia coli]|nr:carboxyltransferase domain-containing protein [Escherichia coli]
MAEVVELHSRATYHVYALGFTPGFAFMGDVDERLRLPRRAAPRKQVPAHRVAMAAGQTGVYPLPSPGGWHLLGTALDYLVAALTPSLGLLLVTRSIAGMLASTVSVANAYIAD